MKGDGLRRRLRGVRSEPDRAAPRRVDVRVLERLPGTRRRTYPRGTVLVAGGLAVLVLVVLLGPRFVAAARRQTPSTRLASAAPGQSATRGPDCRLPLVVQDSRQAASSPAAAPTPDYPGALPTLTAGFVALDSGTFQADPSARADGMPFDQMYLKQTWQPMTYDSQLKRWLPTVSRAVSPDHRAFAYVVYSPLATGKGSKHDSSTLHVYDVTARSDRALWTYPGDIAVDAWMASGIAVDTVPAGGGVPESWLVDAASAAVTPTAARPPWVDLRAYGLTRGGSVGTDAQGRLILIDGSRDPGASYTYFLDGLNGQRIVIHAGTMGDATDFDPNGFFIDGDQLWAANHDGTAIWLWTERGGLRRFPLNAGPKHDIYTDYRVAGPLPAGCSPSGTPV